MTTRRHFSPEQKATIVRRHLGSKEPVYNLAEDVGVQPSQTHLWVKQLLDQAERAFPSSGRKRIAASPDQIAGDGKSGSRSMKRRRKTI